MKYKGIYWALFAPMMKKSIVLDYFLITKTQFFQHYISETKGCAGYHSFGYNRKEQLRRIVTLPFAAPMIAWVCTLF